MAETGQQLKVPADAGRGPGGEVKRWLLELDYADKAEKDWRLRGQAVVDRYRNEKSYAAGAPTKRSKDTFNVLWSNVETMRPAIYNSTPEPVVSDRFGDDSPLVKCAIDVLRRALKYTLSSQDFDQTMNLAVQDYLLPGRAGVRVRYVPTLQPQDKPLAPVVSLQPVMSMMQMPGAPRASADEGTEAAQEPGEDLTFEEVRFELVDWDGFRLGYAETWPDVPWIAFEHDLRYDDLVDLVGKAMADKVPLSTHGADDDDNSADDDEGVFKTACVYEIWDKRARQIIYLCPDYKDSALKKQPDEYELSGFWPMPRMLYALETSETLVPAPEFSQYETLADDLEMLTQRMAGLARSCIVRGFYPKELADSIQSLMQSEETKLVPADDGDRLMELGGLDKAIAFFPLDAIIKAYQALSVERENVKSAIYELMGASDIMRGATEAMETATAQRIKSRWGSVRLRRRQAEIERFCRDLLAIAAELIAGRFSLQTLRMMTGARYPMQAERDAARAQVQQLQGLQQQIQANPQAAQQVPPQALQQGQQMLSQAQELASQPCWEEILAFLRNDAMRRFKIDVQTDSTIALQQHEDQVEFAGMITALGDFTEKLMPLVSGGALPFDAAKEMLLATCRKFRLGYEVAEAIGQMKQPPPQDPAKSPEGLALQATLASQEKIAAGKAQADAAMKTQDQQAEAAKIAADAKLKEQAQSNALALQQSNDQRQQVLDAQEHERKMAELAVKERTDAAVRDQGLVETKIKALAQIATARITQGIDPGEQMLALLEQGTFSNSAVFEQLINGQRQSTQAVVDQLAQMGAHIGGALGALHAATVAPRKRVLVRGPDGRASHAIDAVDPGNAP